MKVQQGVDFALSFQQAWVEREQNWGYLEAEGTMVVTARPVRLEQGVKHSGIVTSEAEAY